MPIANYAEYLSKVNNSVRILEVQKDFSTTMGSSAGRWFSLWRDPALVGAVPSAPAVCTNTTAGAAPGFTNSVLAQRLCRCHVSQGTAGATIIADRLSHQGGLSGTATGIQTTNLPTAALTRHTGGVGVWAALEIYTAIGGTATAARIRYTSDTGEVDVFSPWVPFGGGGAQLSRFFLLMPLLPGHRGVRSVSGVELLASTGTVGNFGVTLFKPLLIIPSANPFVPPPVVFDGIIGGCGYIPEVVNDACLFALTSSSTDIPGDRSMTLTLVEE